MGLFDGLFNNKPQQDAANAQKAGLNAGYNLGSTALGQGRDALTTNYGAGTKAFSDLLTTYAPGTAAYGDATGANGAEGLARAKALFTQTPGYTEGLDQGMNALDRRAASRGMLASGNNEQDTLKFANDYANQKYGSYVAGLQPYLAQNTQAATGLGTLDASLGQQLNNNFTNQGQLGFQTQVGIGNAQANADLAKAQSSKNLFDGLLGVGGGALKLLGGL